MAGVSLRGDETVIDAGCGTGTLTRVLADVVPRGRVLALDISPAMLESARRELADLAPRVEVRAADLGALDLDGEADFIFSAATFHWVLDQDALYHQLFRALKPGGSLRAQCGGEGNLTRIIHLAETLITKRWPSLLTGWMYPARFLGVGETEARIRRAGFEDVDITLVEAPTAFETAEVYRAFLDKVVLEPMLARLPSDDDRGEILDELVARAIRDPSPFTLDYVRLNICGRRPPHRLEPGGP